MKLLFQNMKDSSKHFHYYNRYNRIPTASSEKYQWGNTGQLLSVTNDNGEVAMEGSALQSA